MNTFSAKINTNIFSFKFLKHEVFQKYSHRVVLLKATKEDETFMRSLLINVFVIYEVLYFVVYISK